MGPTHHNAEVKILNPNDYFLSMIPRSDLNSMKVEVDVLSQAILDKWAYSLKKVTQVGSQRFLMPTNYKKAQKSMCGDSFKLEIQYQCFHILLLREIEKRREVEKYLQEAQMWYLVFCLVEAASLCHQLGRPVGDIRPSNLLLSKTGKLKILSNLSLPLDSQLFQDNKRIFKCLFSPQEIESIKKSQYQSHINYLSAQSFSIGMSILSAGVLQDLTKCYIYGISEINMVELNKVLTFWHQNKFYSEIQEKSIEYSRQLKEVVLGMVQMNPERRLTSLEVYQMLKGYKEDIMNLTPFQFKVEKSPKKKNSVNMSSGHQGIHLLRSKKSSLKNSPQKTQKVSITQYKQGEINFELNSPSVLANERNSVNQNFSPVRKKKISTCLFLSQKKEQGQFK